MYCPIILHLPCDSSANSLLANLKSTGSNCQMVRLLETNRKYMEYVPTEFGDFAHGSALTYHTLSTSVLSGNVPSLPLPACNYSTVLPKELSDVYEGLKLSHDEALLLEEETRYQSTYKGWHEVLFAYVGHIEALVLS